MGNLDKREGMDASNAAAWGLPNLAAKSGKEAGGWLAE